MVRVRAWPGAGAGIGPSFKTNVSACGHGASGPSDKVQYRFIGVSRVPFL
jgi:hypothetical protein